MSKYLLKQPMVMVEAHQINPDTLEFIQEWARCTITNFHPQGRESVLKFEFHDDMTGYASMGDYILQNSDGSFELMCYGGFKHKYEPLLKSDIIKEIAKEQGREVVDLKLKESDTSDFQGLPIINKEG